MTRIIYEIPADDAGWLGVVSATFNSRPACHSGRDETASKTTLEQAMARRINGKRRKRAAKINMRHFWHLHSQGIGVPAMAVELGVSTRSVEQAMTMRPRDG